jgi:serine protease Do
LLEQASPLTPDARLRESATRIWGLTVQDLTPVLAESLGLAGLAGVLVSDASRTGAGARTLRRGDVIVGVDGVAVRDVATLRRAAAAAAGVRALDVRRDGAPLRLEFEAPRG